MHFNPIGSRFELLKDVSLCLQNDVVDFSLLNSEFSVYWKDGGNIRNVVMERMTLICEHGLPILQVLIVDVIVQRCSSVTTATYWKIRRNSTG